MNNSKRPFRLISILGAILWCFLGIGIMTLLVAAVNSKNAKSCKALKITISGVQKNYFIDKEDVLKLLSKYTSNGVVGKMVSSFNLAAIEHDLVKNEWIKSSKVYFDNIEVLHIQIIEREPVARVFCTNGSSFYIDSSGVRLSLSQKISARVPVFTSFPTENIIISGVDSSLLSSIEKISVFICNDPFWMAQIDQVDITPQNTFELIPKLGNQVISFGGIENYQQKFKNLLLFYQNVECKVGWNKYSRINLEYKNQVVAVRRGAEDIKMDSVRTKQLMQALIQKAQTEANDSTHSIQMMQTPEDNMISRKLEESSVSPQKKLKPVPFFQNKRKSKTISKNLDKAEVKQQNDY